ncbi:ATP-binding protein, partial [Streptomyces lunaelactis]|uniref:ATP-binding protein n=1 Tax=Streptomyces lunaelactis TaxID=1535768 RepID=UPI001C2FC419
SEEHAEVTGEPAASKGCTAGSGRRPLEKGPRSGNLASGLPVLLHGSGTEFALRMIHTAGELRIEVYDGSPARPYERAAGPDDESGRGMAIVAAIAHTWGTSGPTTWCTLTVPTAGKAQ